MEAIFKINQTVAKDQRTQNRNTGSEANSGLTGKINKTNIQNLAANHVHILLYYNMRKQVQYCTLVKRQKYIRAKCVFYNTIFAIIKIELHLAS
jgi:hypothetical protein